MSVTISKDFLEHSHACLFVYCLWLLLPYNGGLSGWNRDHMDKECMACKALNIYYLMSLCTKSLLNLEFLREPDLKKKKGS